MCNKYTNDMVYHAIITITILIVAIIVISIFVAQLHFALGIFT